MARQWSSCVYFECIQLCQTSLYFTSIKNRRLVIAYAHFLCQSFSRGYLTPREVGSLCSSIPLVDNYGHVVERRTGVLVPASVSKWADLTVSNPWRDQSYVEFWRRVRIFLLLCWPNTRENKLLHFFVTHAGASDLPCICALDAGISGVDTPLTKEKAFLLLDWIRDWKYMGMSLPEKFLKCIKEGSWLKVTVNGYRPPWVILN